MENPGIAGRVIAVLEDDAAVRSAVTMWLEAHGVLVVAGSTGLELAGRIVASGCRPAVVIADYHLGWDTAIVEVPEVITVANPDVRVIVTTGDTSLETAARIAGCGWRLLIKPFRPHELIGVIGDISGVGH